MSIIEEIKAELEALYPVVPNMQTVGREVIIDSLRYLPPEAKQWLAHKKDQRLTVYVIAGRFVHEIAADCETVAIQDNRSLEAKCDYRLIALQPEATFSCELARAEENGLIKTATTYRFRLNAMTTIEIVHGFETKEPERKKMDSFAEAFVAEIDRRKAEAA